jgi:hypothetical protein
MAIEKDVALDIASELASLQAEQGDDVSEEAAPEADSVESDPGADDESEEIENTDEDEESLEDDEPAALDGDAESFKSELAELIDGGDLKAAAEKLGLDPSVFKLNNRQFKAARVAAKEAREAKTVAETAAATALTAQKQAETLNARAEEVYGPVVAGKHHYKNGNVLEARAALELLFEDTYENIVTNMAKGAKAMDPARLEVEKLRRELAAEKAAKATETAATSAATQKATEIAGITAKLKGTPLEDLSDEAAADIHAVISKSYNSALGKHTVTLKEAYAQVKKQYAEKAAKLAKLSGKAPVVAPKGKTREPLEKTKLAPRVATGKKLSEQDEFAAELAAAKKETAAAARRDQRRAK